MLPPNVPIHTIQSLCPQFVSCYHLIIVQFKCIYNNRIAFKLYVNHCRTPIPNAFCHDAHVKIHNCSFRCWIQYDIICKSHLKILAKNFRACNACIRSVSHPSRQTICSRSVLIVQLHFVHLFHGDLYPKQINVCSVKLFACFTP